MKLSKMLRKLYRVAKKFNDSQLMALIVWERQGKSGYLQGDDKYISQIGMTEKEEEKAYKYFMKHTNLDYSLMTYLRVIKSRKLRREMLKNFREGKIGV